MHDDHPGEAAPRAVPASALALYRLVLGARLAERRITELAGAGELGGHHSALGHEAIGVGIGLAVEHADVVQPSYRSGASIMHARGLSLRELVLQGFGLIPGVRDQVPGQGRILRSTGLVGSQVPIGVGIAMAFKLRRRPHVMVTVFGDGAASEGAVHEALNVAGVKDVPIVFVIENNGFGLSSRFADLTRAKTLADRGAGYGIEACIADGYDVTEVHRAVSAAVRRAREDGHPSIVEVKILRPGPHAVGMPDPRSPDEFAAAVARDCVTVARQRALDAGELTEADDERLQAELQAVVDDATAEARAARAARASDPNADRYTDAEAWRLAHSTPAPAWMEG